MSFSPIKEYLRATDAKSPPPTHVTCKAFVGSIVSRVCYLIFPNTARLSGKRVDQFRPQKAIGTDGLLSKILKGVAPAISSAVTKIINLSIALQLSGHWPISGRRKFGQQTNYRSINIQNVLS